jgi:FkbM family methyltransferase
LLPYFSLLSKNDFKQEYNKNLHSIEKVKQLLFDEKSRDIFNSLFKWFWDLDLTVGGGRYLFNSSKEFNRYIYFDPTVYKPTQNEHLIDCGAYNGDSLLACPFQLSKYDGFEADLKNYQDLISNKIIDNNNFKAWNCAVGAYDGIIQFSNEGTVASKVYEEKSTKFIDVEVARIDSKIPDSKPTIIKMDIEGYELKALEGCKKLDITNAVFAICTYHKLSHLWEVPLMLNKLAKNHKLIFRSYGEDWFETIIYAVPESRIVN